MNKAEKQLLRAQRILKYINKNHRGIEVGGWFAPLAPKTRGYDCLALDVFDFPALKQRALDDPEIDNAWIANIQEVELLGTSTEIESLVAKRNELGRFDYIVSSHNFEHLPNPIKFLQGSGKVLRSGGFLSMAIPDRRVCFDVYKPASTLSQWIEAYFEDRVQPTQAQIFNHISLMANYNRKQPYKSVTNHDLRLALKHWTNNREKTVVPYEDAHCWTFTPSSFELLIRDAHFLGLSPFTVKEITPNPIGIEFHAHLINSGFASDPTEAETQSHKDRRLELLGRMLQEPQCLVKPRHKIQNFFRGS
jgi:predicted SAM-dependent methyltransferase